MDVYAFYAAYTLISTLIFLGAVRRMDKRHAAALKKMQTALWNDRQLRLGRTPSTSTGKTIPLPETGEKSV
jgi:hypothetical protein